MDKSLFLLNFCSITFFLFSILLLQTPLQKTPFVRLCENPSSAFVVKKVPGVWSLECLKCLEFGVAKVRFGNFFVRLRGKKKCLEFGVR